MPRSEPTPTARVSRQRLAAAAHRLGPLFGLRLVALFGSRTRPDAAAPRDIDLAVLGPGPVDTVALTNAFIRELGTQAVDIADLRRADPLLLALVARDGAPLYESAGGAFDSFCSLAVRRYADTAKFRDAERQVIRDVAGLDPSS